MQLKMFTKPMGMMQCRRLLTYVGMGYCCVEVHDRMEMMLLHHTMFHALPTQLEHTFIVLKCHCRVRYMHIEQTMHVLCS